MLEEKNDNLHMADGKADSVSESTASNDKERALHSITESNAAESEDNSVEEKTEIPEKNYDNLETEDLAKELKYLISNFKITAIKDQAEEIKRSFYRKYNDLYEEHRDTFLEENPDANETDFDFHFPLKNTFDAYFTDYKDKKNTYYKQLQENLNTNLKKRLDIIERIKDLVDESENMTDALKVLNELREEWKNAGSIPRDKYNHVWNNYHFHIERFYDQLHLDRESRDMDFKYNLDQKQKIIARAEELLQEDDIIKAFRELQTLHRIWREEIGPVERELREDIWNQFSELTKQLHDKRESLFEKLKEVERENLSLKVAIISEIDTISKNEYNNHNMWQNQIKKVETLRNRFFSIGKVPSENNDEVWYLFKLATRNFNLKKNNFYKELKREQQENYSKKIALIEKAESLKDSEDFNKVTPIMKQIQEEWKHIGHVPRKHSDRLWKEFKDACNHYFNRLHSIRDKENEAENSVYLKKKEYLEVVKNTELTGDHKTDLDIIKNHIQNWKEIGRVGYNKRFIESKFNKILDTLFDKLSLSKREAELVKFNNLLDSLTTQNDQRKLQQETLFIQRKIDEINSNLLQLQNNIQFISNATPDNPLVKEVNKNIAKYEDDLKIWQEKLDKIKRVNL